MPRTPRESREYLGDLLGRRHFDVVCTRHPAHATDEYEDVGVTWLVESCWPEPDWLERFRSRLLDGGG